MVIFLYRTNLNKIGKDNKQLFGIFQYEASSVES